METPKGGFGSELPALTIVIGSDILFGGADPVGAPAAGHEVQFNTNNSTLWIWNGAAWTGVVLST